MVFLFDNVQVRLTTVLPKTYEKMLFWTHKDWSNTDWRITWMSSPIRGAMSVHCIWLKVDCNPGRCWLCILILRVCHCIRHIDSCSSTGLVKNISHVDWPATGLIRGTSRVTCLSTAQARWIAVWVVGRGGGRMNGRLSWSVFVDSDPEAEVSSSFCLQN